MIDELLQILYEAVRQVCRDPGFGEVTVIIEKGQPRRLRIIREPKLTLYLDAPFLPTGCPAASDEQVRQP